MQLRKLQILTITHQNLSVEELKHFVLPQEETTLLAQKLRDLKQAFNITELIYLNTCNRVSFIMATDEYIDTQWIKRYISAINPKLEETVLNRLPKFVDAWSGVKALKHLYQVASSVDSLVVGEREIFRQFRQAYNFALEHGLTGDFLRLVQESTVKVAKHIYTHTKIGERPVSVASLAFQKLLETEIDKASKVLLIGAGETNTNIARFLSKHDFGNVVVFNRSINNANEIGTLLKAETNHLSDLASYSGGFDSIIVCTGSTTSIIDIPTYRSLLQKDARRKVIVDLSVPRNVDPAVVEQFDIEYIDIENLRSLAEINMNFRKQEVAEAMKIIESMAEEFDNKLQIRRVEKALREIPQAIKSVKEKAISEVFKSDIEKLDGDSRQILMDIVDYMEKKCIAVPMKVAKASIQAKK